MGRTLSDNTGQLRKQVVRLSIVTLAVLVAGIAVLCAYAWRAVDADQAQREETLVARTIVQWQQSMLQETTSAAEWDDAFVRTGERDLAWIDDYFAGYYRSAFGHDVTLLLDSQGRSFYGAADGRRAGLEGLAIAARPLAQRLQAQALLLRLRATRRADARAEVSFLAARAAILTDRTGTYVVGVSTILPSRGLPKGSEPTT